MVQVNWWKRLLGRKSPDESAMAQQQPGQKLMTLQERMAFRREMVIESVREVLAQHGVSAMGYRLNVARLDARGHRYAAMIDLIAPTAGRVLDALGEWQAMEREMADAAATRYRVKIANVYWRVDLAEQATTAAAHAAAAWAPDRRRAAVAPTGGRASGSGPAMARRATDPGLDGFADTVVEDRRPATEPIGADELAAFEQALKRAQGRAQPVQVGAKTYQTDYMPLE